MQLFDIEYSVSVTADEHIGRTPFIIKNVCYGLYNIEQ